MEESHPARRRVPATPELAETPKALRTILLALFLATLVIRALTAWSLEHAGYFDAFYYYHLALNMAEGRGLTESVIWNYLDHPQALPRPGNQYWMPLTTFWGWLGIRVAGGWLGTWRAAQLPFVLGSALLPPLAAWLCWQGWQRRGWALGAGVLTIFSGFYFTYWVVTDNYTPFALAVALALLGVWQGRATGRARWWALAGAGAGLSHLARVDGALLVPLIAGFLFWDTLRGPQRAPASFARCALAAAGGYLLFMAPWWLRNWLVVGTPFPGGGTQTLWLRQYNEIFTYDIALTPQRYLAWGLGPILASKGSSVLWGSLIVLGSMQFFLAPFVLAALRAAARRPLFQPFLLYTLLLLTAMPLVFTFPSRHGSLLHSAAALLPWMMALAPPGMDRLVRALAARRPRWDVAQATRYPGRWLCGARRRDHPVHLRGRGLVGARAERHQPALGRADAALRGGGDVAGGAGGAAGRAHLRGRPARLLCHHGPRRPRHPDRWPAHPGPRRARVVGPVAPARWRLRRHLRLRAHVRGGAADGRVGARRHLHRPARAARGAVPLSRRPMSRAARLAPLAALLALALYLLAARGLAGTLAFPLDDAWIHQSYARTVAQQGAWAFLPGAPSSGSTSPLWTLLLVPGHWLPVSPVWWSHALGVLLWAGVIGLGARLALCLFDDRQIAGWCALALAAEWHLAWAALSGMEIGLYSALALLLLLLYLEGRGGPWLWGIVGGALTLARPEGLLLLALIGAHQLWRARRAAPRALGAMGLGWLLLVLPYALFNWRVSGVLFPNTFYAKQQEYGLLLATVPLWRRAAALAWQPWLGGQALLLLALPSFPWRRLRSEQWLPLLWALGIVLLYALRLPVSYQHGRYLMPTIPVFVIYGVAALLFALRRVAPRVRRALGASVLAGFASFLLLGALAYGQDVAWIECEMGASARWVAAHSAPDDLIAAHDIGRLGYLARRPILDFAGLISPETIPILRDERALLDLAQQRGARYLVTFADWYPTLPRDPRLTPRHATACAATPARGPPSDDHLPDRATLTKQTARAVGPLRATTCCYLRRRFSRAEAWSACLRARSILTCRLLPYPLCGNPLPPAACCLLPAACRLLPAAVKTSSYRACSRSPSRSPRRRARWAGCSARCGGAGGSCAP